MLFSCEPRFWYLCFCVSQEFDISVVLCGPIIWYLCCFCVGYESDIYVVYVWAKILIVLLFLVCDGQDSDIHASYMWAKILKALLLTCELKIWYLC